MMKSNSQKYAEVCKRINEICSDPKYEYKEIKQELIRLLDELKMEKVRDVVELKQVIELHRRLCKIKNRKASYIENEMAKSLLVDLPFLIIMKDEDIPEGIVEELKEEYSPDERMGLRLSSELLKYGKELISGKEEKSKRYKNRIKEMIRMLNELQQNYKIEGIKEIFKSRITDEDVDVQFFALCGLEVFYSDGSTEELKEEEEELEEIIKSTKTREVASACCQILINAGKIDELEAMMRIDAWKDRNWRGD